MVSRLAAATSVLLVVLSVVYVWGVSASPDSDLKVGLIVALPLVAVAGAFAALARWTRRPPPGGE